MLKREESFMSSNPELKRAWGDRHVRREQQNRGVQKKRTSQYRFYLGSG